MSWVTVIWAMIASACLTLGMMNLVIWVQQTRRRAHLLFSVTAISVAAVAGCELLLMRAQTTEQFGTVLKWAHVPVFFTFVSIVGFVRLYLRAGRSWLGYSVCGLRLLVLIINFLSVPNLNYKEITGLRHLTTLGGETISVAEGVRNPWIKLDELSVLLLLVFVADASITLWRRGDRSERRRALIVGGSTTFFILEAAGQAELVNEGLIQAPYLISLPFLAMVAAMGYELSQGVLRARRLSDDLRESQQRMALAVDAANLGLWVWEASKDEVWMTDQGRALFGFGPNTRLDYAILISRAHPDDRAMRDATLKRAVETQGEYAMEYRVLLPDGTLRWIGARGRCINVEDGKGVRLFGVSMDVTAQKESQDALRESEARFRALADTAPVMIWMSGPDKLCNFFNQGWLDFTGRSFEQEFGNGWAEGVHREDLDRCLEVYVNSFNGRQSFTMEYRLRRCDGEYRWVLDTGTPRFAADGTFLGYIGSCLDITDRKQAEERFRLAVEASPNGMVLVNAQGKIVLANACLEKLFGYEIRELIGQAVELLVPERFRSNHLAHRAGFHTAPVARAMGAGRELFARRKDGTEFPVEIGISPIQSPEGTLVLSVIVDITERKRAEFEAQQHREEIAHLGRLAIMGEMAGSLAHELSQPLGAIVTNVGAALRFLERDNLSAEKLRELLQDIAADGKRAGEVIRTVRGMGRKEAGARRLLQLNDVIAEVLRLTPSDALGHHCTVSIELDPLLPKVDANSVQLQEVFLNLIQNAFEASEAVPRARRRVIIRTERDSDYAVRVSVRDFGPGLPLELPERVFERFFSTKTEGLGIGLFISRSIIAAHGGTLSAENAEGGGAQFWARLPVSKEINL
jgi:two-component system, LuxR family, sensor kinase FixL